MSIKLVYVNNLRIGGVSSTIDNLWRLLYPKNTREPNPILKLPIYSNSMKKSGK